jgi:hypothetical protein
MWGGTIMIGTPSRPATAPRRRSLGDMGLAIALAAMFLTSWVVQFIVEIVVVRNELQSARPSTMA